ncbi:Calcium permeable stress-gated cation channel 1 [Smittium culicis]|uniref:Calcium permeable stress-gated cation channel 1 n=1 Tax=Smittium culicis TaxID=133412 RepID=A0A1R1XLX7_9FUNG|nr:Calcium permeable stress-gated cation channel 1 [Smittium culicis]OMJ21649.1 Calcium permeable stress-gated cation channel 1 [Smittium culicis]
MAFFGIFIIVPLEARYNSINSPKIKPPNNTENPLDINNIFSFATKSIWSYLTSAALGSNQVLVAHLVFGYFFVGLVYFMASRFAYQTLSLRWSFLHRLQKSAPVRTIMLRNIPDNFRSAESLKNYFEDIGVGEVESSCIIPKFTELDHLIKMRAKLLLQIERRYADLLGNPCTANGYDPKVLAKFFHDTTDSNISTELKILYDWAKSSSPKTHSFRKKIETWIKKTHNLRDKFFSLDLLVRKERHEILNDSYYNASNVGFVTFSNAKSAQVAAQLNLYSHPQKFIASLAPEPRDIYWPNLTVSAKSRIIRTLITRLVILLMFVFWLVPITALSALLSPEFIDSYVPGFCKFVKNSPILNTFLRFTVPSLILFAYNELYPYFLTFLNIIAGQRMISRLQMETIQQYFFYLVVSVLLIFTLSSAILDKLKQWIENPAEIPKSLADTLPKAAPFFMSYIVLLGIGYYPLRLMSRTSRSNKKSPNLFSNVNYDLVNPKHSVLDSPVFKTPLVSGSSKNPYGSIANNKKISYEGNFSSFFDDSTNDNSLAELFNHDVPTGNKPKGVSNHTNHDSLKLGADSFKFSPTIENPESRKNNSPIYVSNSTNTFSTNKKHRAYLEEQIGSSDSNSEIYDRNYNEDGFRVRVDRFFSRFNDFFTSFDLLSKLNDLKDFFLENVFLDSSLLSSRDLFENMSSPDTNMISSTKDVGKQPLNHGNGQSGTSIEFNLMNSKRDLMYSSNLVYSRHSRLSPLSEENSLNIASKSFSSELDFNKTNLVRHDDRKDKSPQLINPVDHHNHNYEVIGIQMPQSTELRWYGNTSESAIEQNSKSDYSQSGMTNCFGVLDSNNQPYMYPQLVGMLPYLWLPSKPVPDPLH